MGDVTMGQPELKKASPAVTPKTPERSSKKLVPQADSPIAD
jgi:hypothetical protein